MEYFVCILALIFTAVLREETTPSLQMKTMKLTEADLPNATLPVNGQVFWLRIAA